MLGPDARFEIEWASVYTFQCRRMQRRSATAACCSPATRRTSSSPFGARGANSGIQDADNLALEARRWCIAGSAPERLLDSYDVERTAAADENILQLDARDRLHHARRARVSRTFRDAVLAAREAAPVRAPAGQQRAAVGAGGSSSSSPLNTPDRDATSRRPARWCPAPRPPTRRSRRAAGPGSVVPAATSKRGFTLARVRRRAGRRATSRRCAGDDVPVSRRAGRAPGAAPGGRRRDRATPRGCWPRATTRGPAPSTCCVPTSTSARAGAPSIRRRRAVRAAIARATARALTGGLDDGHAQHRRRTCRRRTTSTSG